MVPLLELLHKYARSLLLFRHATPSLVPSLILSSEAGGSPSLFLSTACIFYCLSKSSCVLPPWMVYPAIIIARASNYIISMNWNKIVAKKRQNILEWTWIFIQTFFLCGSRGRRSHSYHRHHRSGVPMCIYVCVFLRERRIFVSAL